MCWKTKIKTFIPITAIIFLLLANICQGESIKLYPVEDGEVYYLYNDDVYGTQSVDGQWWPAVKYVSGHRHEMQLIFEFDISDYNSLDIVDASFGFHIGTINAFDSMMIEIYMYDDGNLEVDAGDFEAGYLTYTIGWSNPEPGSKQYHLDRSFISPYIGPMVRYRSSDYLGFNIRLKGDEPDYDENVFNESDNWHYVNIASMENNDQGGIFKPYLLLLTNSILDPPSNQQAFSQNNSVLLKWDKLSVGYSIFQYYAIYRDTAPFDNVTSMTPIATIDNVHTTTFTDPNAVNGMSYYYAVTSISDTNDANNIVTSIGPRTPRSETDLQVVSISRTPSYPRYWPWYQYYDITEANGFGPYTFSSAMGLSGGQDANTAHWPSIDDAMSYTATIRNRGTNSYSQMISGQWLIDGQVVATAGTSMVLLPGQIVTCTYELPWTNESNDITFELTCTDDKASNNSLTTNTTAVGFLTYIDSSMIEQFREDTVNYPNSVTDDLIDWSNRHMERLNQMFADTNCTKRVHYDVLEVIDQTDPEPDVERINYAIFPFRFRVGDDYRQSGYYREQQDIDYGFLHEMGHQLGLIDLYQLDVPSGNNYVNNTSYTGPNGLMRTCAEFISEHSALAMNYWEKIAHGYYGQYLYCMPEHIQIRFLGKDNNPVPDANVTVYQYCQRPGQGKVITDQIKFQGTTDANGIYRLPNVNIDTNNVPITYAGDQLKDNPFGYVAVVGTNVVLLFEVDYGGYTDYAWFDITEANIRYWKGQTQTAIFDKQVQLAGAELFTPPAELTELNAYDWITWADSGEPNKTYVIDDTNNVTSGTGAIKFVTDGLFDTYLRYPKTYTAKWNLTKATHFCINFYAVNDNIGFQNHSPWIYLIDNKGNKFMYQYYRNGNPYDYLNDARNQWLYCEVPIEPPNDPTGWHRTAIGTPDMANIQAIEIHADTWGNSFDLWVDGLKFNLPEYKYCDLNNDDIIDFADLGIYALNWLTDAANWSQTSGADINMDGEINLVDFSYFANIWMSFANLK